MEWYEWVCDVAIWYEPEVTFSDHGARKFAHDWCSLNMEILNHFVAAPAANEFDAVMINVGTEESHSARGPKGSGRYVTWY